MRRKIIGIFVCMLLIATVIPVGISEKNTIQYSTVQDARQTSMTGNWTEIQKLLASDGEDLDFFGISVSLNGDSAIIGAVGDDSYLGSVYVFTRSGLTWTEQAKLVASDGATNDWFGFPVSLDGDSAIIGAYGDDDNGGSSGSAYVFTRSGSTWTEQAKLVASDGAASDEFGYSVAIDGDFAVIGAIGDDSVRGSAYVFTRSGSTWTEQAKLVASDGAVIDYFGWSVALDGNTALIGTPAVYGSSTGAAYVFTRSGSTWTEQAKLVASDGAVGDWFGWSVSLDGDTAIIGAIADDSIRGSAYVFTRSGSTWTEQAKLVASDGAAGDFFGYSVSLGDNIVCIGAYFDDYQTGSAYVFTRSGSTWTEQAKLVASDGAASDKFGKSVSLSGDFTLIGAQNHDNRGAVYVFMKEKENYPPLPPTITGPANGKIKVATKYNFTTTDPNYDNVSYYIDWGDDTNSGWIGSYPSGDIINQSHTWTKKGDYTIKAKAKDNNGAESDWGELPVTMPCSYNLPFMQLWERFFQRFTNAFPLLRHMMGY